MPLFTAAQLQRVREIVERHHQGIAVSVFGVAAMPEVVAELKKLGLVDESAPPLIEQSMAYAILMARAGDLDLMNAEPAEVLKRLRANPAPPLTDTEKAIVETAAKHAGQYVKGLSDRVTSTIMRQVAAEEGALTPEKVRGIIADKTAASRERRESASSLKKALTDELGNWSRDWQRIATSETNDAIQEGTALSFEKDHGADEYVSKIVRPDACPDCKRLYLDGGEPRVFKLSELRANGTNVGKKRNAWMPTVGNVHPWCGCQLVRVPKGMHWVGGELLPQGMRKAVGGPYIGPRGGRWADPQHTIPWTEPLGRVLFHSAPAHAMEAIQEQGLVPRAGGGTFQHGGYAEHSQGKVFLSDNHAAALDWHGKVEDQLFHHHDDESMHKAVMLRVKHRPTKRDEVGDKDVRGSRYVTSSIPPEHLEFYDREHGWRPIQHYEPGRARVPKTEAAAHHPGTEAHRILAAKQQAAKQQDDARERAAAEQKARDDIEANERNEWAAKGIEAREAKARELLAKKSPIPGVTLLYGRWQRILNVDAQGRALPDVQKSLAGPFIGPRGGKWADAAHTIPWKESEHGSKRTGAIRTVTNEQVHAVAAAIDDLRVRRSTGQVMSLGEPKFTSTKIKTADGRELPFTVYQTPRPDLEDPRGVSGEVRLHTEVDERGNATVVGGSVHVYVKLTPGEDADDMRQRIRSVLAHEMTHAADPSLHAEKRAQAIRSVQRDGAGGTRTIPHRSKSYADYVNERAEVTARVQQIARDILDKKSVAVIQAAYDDHKADPENPPPYRPEDVVAWSPTWEHVERHLTPENRKRVLRAVADVLDGIHHRRLEPIAKSDLGQGGPFVGPRGGRWADPQHTIPWHDEAPPRVPSTLKEAGAQIAARVWMRHGHKPGSGFPGHDVVAKNWAGQLKGSITPAGKAERALVQTAVDDNHANPRFRAFLEKHGHVPVVVREKGAHGHGQAGPDVIYVTALNTNDALDANELRDEKPRAATATSEWGGVAAVHRHEYAHHLFRTLTKEQQARWEREAPAVEEFAAHVSRYSKKNTEEAFCELFATATSRHFDESAFPEHVRGAVRLMHELLGVTLEKSHKLHDRYEFQGLPISVENAAGSVRKWYDPRADEEGHTFMAHDYGYIRETTGADDEHIDCYVGPDEHAKTVYVVHQRKKQPDGSFEGHDEDKVMLGFSSQREAENAYLLHYDDERFLGGVTAMPLEKFKRVLEANKGRKLSLVKSFAPGQLAHEIHEALLRKGELLDLAPLAQPPRRYTSIVQGADNVPRPKRSKVMVDMADELGLTAKGRKKKQKEQQERVQDARDRRAARAFYDWPMGGIPAADVAGASKNAREYTPQMLAEFREQARAGYAELAAHKLAMGKHLYEQRRGLRVSDMTAQMRRKKLQDDGEGGNDE